VFFAIVLSIWALLHVYVGTRFASVPWVAAHLGMRGVGFAFILLWLSFPVARLLAAHGWRGAVPLLEFVGSTWLGLLFLLFVALLAVEVFTLGGWLLPRLTPQLRGVAVGVAGVLAAIALAQGLRAPVVREYEVTLAHLPREADGLSLVVVSDLHLGTLVGRRWLTALVAQIDALKPDTVLIAGDLVDSDADSASLLAPVLQTLHAPRGVWLALGNHDAYAGAPRVTEFAEAAGVRVLRNRGVELAPGLRLVGIDDPAVLRRGRADKTDRRLERAFDGSPRNEATILLAHTPDRHDVEAAAAAGTNLMFCGHTHGGQIWPFSYLVQRRFPLFVGRYEVNGLTLFVCRGTATWGPRMRLWQPGELLHVRLRSGTP
jgi:predicted MPP superfamily phosphohydrolase